MHEFILHFGQEKVRNGVENHLFCYLCKYFAIK